MTPRPDIIERALSLIKPKPEQRAACATAIGQRDELLRRIHLVLGAIPSPGDLKKRLKKIGGDLRRTRRLLDEPSGCVAAVVGPDFLGEFDRLIDSAQFYHDAIAVRHGSRRWDNVKAIAARYANELLRSFGSAPPTKTPDGPFYNLASLLYEGATAKVGVDLEQYCRDVLDNVNELGGSRIEPSIVVRVPLAEH
jgi:hypothetical protein